MCRTNLSDGYAPRSRKCASDAQYGRLCMRHEDVLVRTPWHRRRMEWPGRSWLPLRAASLALSLLLWKRLRCANCQRAIKFKSRCWDSSRGRLEVRIDVWSDKRWIWWLNSAFVPDNVFLHYASHTKHKTHGHVHVYYLYASFFPLTMNGVLVVVSESTMRPGRLVRIFFRSW